MKLRKAFVMSNSDICFVGVELGYEWNTVCDEIGKNEAYGMDGSGYFTMYKDEADITFDSEMLTKIFEKIFSDNPEAEEIIVLDDF